MSLSMPTSMLLPLLLLEYRSLRIGAMERVFTISNPSSYFSSATAFSSFSPTYNVRHQTKGEVLS